MNGNRWQPLSEIYYGIATANFRPSTSDKASTSTSARNNRYSWSRDSNAATLRLNGGDEGVGNVFEQEVLVGDEVYAFESCTSDDGVEWYRGYVLPHVDVSTIAKASSSEATREPLVYLGIFPSSIVHIQSRSPDTEGILKDAFDRFNAATALSTPGTTNPPTMEPVLEEEDESDGEAAGRSQTPRQVAHNPMPNGWPKLQPPLPNLVAPSPDSDHLIDEIGYTIRDWYDRLPAYILDRNYKLFDLVSKAIKALQAARQQMIAKVLTHHEEEALRREVIFNINKGSIAQGLDIVVRDPKSGKIAVVETDVNNETITMSGIKLYTLQVASVHADGPLTNTRLDSVITLDTTDSMKTSTRHVTLGQPDTYVADTADQILVEIKTLVVKLPGRDTVELFCSIYQGSSQSYLTEEFRIELDHGIPVGLPTDTRMRTIFRGLKDLDSSCFLIVRLVRKGQGLSIGGQDARPSDSTSILRSLSKLDNAPNGHVRSPEPHQPKTPQLDSSNDWIKVDPPDNRVRTPLGYAALAIDRVRADRHGPNDFSLEIYSPKDDTSWATVPNEILSNRWDSLFISSEVEAVVISAEVQKHDNQNYSQSMSFSNPLDPYDVTMFPRSDLYLKIWQCKLEGAIGRQISTTLRSSVELRLEVRSNTSGARLAVIKLGGSGPNPDVAEARYVVLRRDLHPLLAEMTKITIPDEPCHALLILYEINPEVTTPRPMGMAHLPLNTGRLAIHPDGAYDLIIQPYVASTVSGMRYLQKPQSIVERTKTAGQDAISVRVQNISARTSNSVVLSLTEQREHKDPEADKPLDILHLMTFIPPLEIVKHLPALLDANFSFLTSNQTSETPETVQDRVAKALSAILDALHDRRFAFRSDPLAAYLEGFTWPATGLPLIKAIRRIISSPDHPDYRQTSKHLSGLIRFVLASRNPIRSTGGAVLAEHLQSQLDSEIHDLITIDLPSIFKIPDPARTLGSRIIVIQQFGQLSTVLSTLYTRAQIAEMLLAFADLINQDTTPSKASQAKLVFLLRDIVLGGPFKDAELRSILMPTLCRIIRAHLIWDLSTDSRTPIATRLETVRLAISTAAAIAHVLSEAISDSKSNVNLVQDQDNLEYVLSALLPHLVTCYYILASVRPDVEAGDITSSKTLAVFPTGPRLDLMLRMQHSDALTGFPVENPIAGECAAVILALLVRCPEDRLQSYLSEYREVHSEGLATQMIVDALRFGDGLFTEHAAPSTWRSLRGMACRALICLISAARASYMDGFQWEDLERSRELWCACLSTALLMVREENGAMLRVSPQQTRTSIWRVWSRLGGEAVGLVTQLNSCQPETLGAVQRREAVWSVVETCMLSMDTIPSLVSLLDGLLRLEWEEDDAFTNVSTYLFELLDRELGGPDPKLRLPKFIFLERLRDLPYKGDDAYRAGLSDLLDILEGYLSLMLKSGEALLAPHEYSLLVLETMDYTKRHGQISLEAKWCECLHDHLIKERYGVGAALSLARKASCLEWSVLTVSGDAKKELVYRLAIQELDSCQQWEIAVEICQALVDYHKHHTYNLKRIAELLGSEALMYSSMSQVKRQETVYYRVTLFNVEEPQVTLCDYIWSTPSEEAGSLLRLACSQMEAKYPGIPVVIDAADDTTTDTQHQPWSVIRITPYYPVPDTEKDCIKLAATLNPYYFTNDVKTFRCIREGPADMECVDVTTADSLPTILPVSPVIGSRVRPIDRLQHAIEEIRRAEQNLTIIDSGLRQGGLAEDPFAAFGLIEGSVDLPHRKGIERYRELLDAQDTAADATFTAAMHDYALRLMDILQRYGEISNEAGRPYRESLVRLFTKNFALEIKAESALATWLESLRQRQGRDISKPVPPLPVDSKAPEESSLSSNKSRSASASVSGVMRGLTAYPESGKGSSHSHGIPANDFPVRAGAESRLSTVSTQASTTRSRMSLRFGSLLGRKRA